MKTKFTLLSFGFFLIASLGFSQGKKDPQSIITDRVAIKKYHNKQELENMPKGQLLDLYVERIESLVRLLPYIAFATKPGVTMTTLGIPNDKDHRNSLEDQKSATDKFLENNLEFQKRILPYSDTNDLTAAILFYEETMKSLHEYSEFR